MFTIDSAVNASGHVQQCQLITPKHQRPSGNRGVLITSVNRRWLRTSPRPWAAFDLRRPYAPVRTVRAVAEYAALRGELVDFGIVNDDSCRHFTCGRRRPIFWRWRELDRVGGQLALVVVENGGEDGYSRAWCSSVGGLTASLRLA